MKTRRTRAQIQADAEQERAALARKTIALTSLELGLLLQCPYDHPHCVGPDEVYFATTLERLGLLESDPTARYVYRVTKKGLEQVRIRWALHDGQ